MFLRTGGIGRVASAAFFLLGALSTRALADDAEEIQARVTARLQAQGVQQPGLFARYTVVRDGPYAWVSAGLGTRGYGSETFVLAKKSGHWEVLASGGGLAGTSEFVSVGIPSDVALNLERTPCSDPGYPSHAITVKHTTLDAAVVRAVRVRGSSALPSRTIEIADDRTARPVTIYPPLDLTSCTFDSPGSRRRSSS
jgi:hypothetical protein